MSKKMVTEAEAEKPDEPRQVLGGRGKAGGEAEQVRKAGVPRTTLRDAKKHVAVAEERPAFQDRKWK